MRPVGSLLPTPDVEDSATGREISGLYPEKGKKCDHKIGTRSEWQAARDELAKLEVEQERSQLLAYSIMFGPDYELGACPGCSSLVDHLDAAALVDHLDAAALHL